VTRGSRGLALLGGLLGLSGVVMAALGSHVVADTGVPGPDRYRSWQAANLLHLLHAVTLLSLAALAREAATRLWGLAGLAMVLGVVLFSGSIYLSILVEGAATGGIAPIGGTVLMLGWLLVALAALVDRQV
jgi:uncharacterized membrane protein YgdD (TMEM256/DUF423 family)